MRVIHGQAVHAAGAVGPLFLDYLRLTKPRVTMMALATAFLGFFMGSRGPLDIWQLTQALLGLLCIGAGANSLNQWLEKDIDACMKRTAARPLPSGRLHETSALFFGTVLSAAGILYLLFFVNGPTAGLGAMTFLSYVFVYTPLKRLTPLNTFVGAIPGALPSVAGWAAAGRLDKSALVLFGILYLWQLPHFFAIAWVYRDDYLKGGLRMFTVYDRGGEATARRIVVYCVLLVLASLVPSFTGIAGAIYLTAALAAGAIFLGYAVVLTAGRLTQAKRFAAWSIVYLLILILFMIADKIV